MRVNSSTPLRAGFTFPIVCVENETGRVHRSLSFMACSPFIDASISELHGGIFENGCFHRRREMSEDEFWVNELS